MMTASQLCLIFIFSFVLGAQSQTSATTPGEQAVTPVGQTVTPVNPTVSSAVKSNSSGPDGTEGLPDIATDVTVVMFEAETELITTAVPSDAEIPTSATPSAAFNCIPPCGANETCSDVDGGQPKCMCDEGYTRVDENSTCEAALNCTPPCEANERCSDVDGGQPKCMCDEDYTRVDENSTCEVKTCDNIHCGPQGSCVGNSTVFLECSCNLNFSFKEGDICINKNCENTDSCSNPEDECINHSDSFWCKCGDGRISINGETACIEKNCSNSCTDNTEVCSDENGYNCSCIEGYSRQGEGWPCMQDEVTTTPKSTETPVPVDDLTDTTALVTDLGTTKATTKAGETPTSKKPTQPQKTSSPTEPTKPAGSSSSNSPSTPDKKDVAGGHNYTGALVGLFIFLVVTCFVFVAVYVFRRRKLRNNYGRLDEDNEGDSGWSAFSKNPIYRGDRDYQLL